MRHGARHLRTTAVVLAASVALVAGCGDASGHAQPDVAWPFGGAAHIPTVEQQLYAAAEESLVADCMHGRGMRYVPERRADPAPEQSGAAIYGLIGPQEARLHGYGMGERRVQGASAPPGANDAARSAMTAEQARAWDRALLGTPGREATIEVDGNVFTYRSDACVTLARHDLFGADWDRIRLTAEVAVNTVVAKVWQDAEVRAAVARWRDCMADDGRDFDSPAEPRKAVDTALAKADLPTALRLEHETAITDADCQRDSGLWDAVVAAQRTAETPTPAAVTSMRTAREKAVAAAREIVGPSAPS
ncbi:hypothetical protein [Asanoa sp. NPDC050611]|uniref:hypothetical protein n=1 Tax=Asanoa sp. NPDC050611 TaxID=3157098 RepID=UPI0033F16B35